MIFFLCPFKIPSHCLLTSIVSAEKSAASLYLLCVFVCVLATQSCLNLCDLMDCSSPGFSVHGLLQARILEWVAIPFSRRSSQPMSPTLQADSLPLSHQGSLLCIICLFLENLLESFPCFWCPAVSLCYVLFQFASGNCSFLNSGKFSTAIPSHYWLCPIPPPLPDPVYFHLPLSLLFFSSLLSFLKNICLFISPCQVLAVAYRIFDLC